MPAGSVRATPTSVPTTSAMIQAPNASDSVQARPLQIQSIYRPTPSGVVSNSKDIGLPLDYELVPITRSLPDGLVARVLDQRLQSVRLRKLQIDVLRRNR